MPKIFLHIGVEKTGSTYLQEILYRNKENLYKEGYVFPDDTLFKYSNHMELTSSYAMEASLKNVHKPSSKKNFKCALKDFILKNSNLNIIFSGEHLSSRLVEQNRIQELCSLLLIGGHKLYIIAYVRNPENWIRSKYNQYIKSGGSENLKTYLKYSENKNQTYRVKGLDQAGNLNAWKNSLEKAHLIIDKYETAKRDDLLKNFCMKVGIDYNVLNISNVKVNLSLLGWQLKIIRLINLMAGKWLKKILGRLFISFNFGKPPKYNIKDSCLIKEYSLKQEKLFSRYFSIHW